MADRKRLQTFDLSFEVKSSRRGEFLIKKRDLSGLNADNEFSRGFLAALVTCDRILGPHWIFVPACKITPRKYDQKSLYYLKKELELWSRINNLWGDALLDDTFTDKLVCGMRNRNTKSIDWLLQQQRPKEVDPEDEIRRLKVEQALKKLQKQLDGMYGDKGAQREGFLHQAILFFCMSKCGFKCVNNNGGVPDISAQIALHEESSDFACLVMG
jgi:hypothetical protein